MVWIGATLKSRGSVQGDTGVVFGVGLEVCPPVSTLLSTLEAGFSIKCSVD